VTTADRAAFTALFGAHHHGVHAFLLGRTSDPDTANDLLQETFLRAWRRFGELAGLSERRQAAWLYTVARNLVIDGYRAAATRRATGETATHDQHTRQVPDIAERSVARHELDRLDRAISDLPDDQRSILSMTVIGGMTSSQIGEVLGLPPGTVRSKLHQARTRLGQTLKASA
jgi:RNA polymerase sigma-70 factor, ECF subfamily